jgi:hypothetical protein
MTAVQPLGEFAAYTYATATNFQISARAPDLRALPFPAVFSPSSAAPGQMISVGATAYASTGGYPYSLPTSITLNPQTIDAVVIAVSTSGPYTVLTVGLAPYDPIVQMNIPGNLVDTLLPNASVVYVYVDSSTSLLNSTALGSAVLFASMGYSLTTEESCVWFRIRSTTEFRSKGKRSTKC